MPEIISRDAARQAGLTHFFTGIPCKRDHISERYTKGGTCVECGAEQIRQYSADHRADVTAKHWQYMLGHPEQREKAKERERQKRLQDPAFAARAAERERRKTDPEYKAAQKRQRAATRRQNRSPEERAADLERTHQHYKDNRDQIAARKKEWYQIRGKDLERQRYQTDAQTLLRTKARAGLYYALKTGRMTKRMERKIGCSLEVLRDHLEAQFQDGMSWQNYGDWHLDHCRPLASFDLMDPEQYQAATNWQNLQPLFGPANWVKHVKPETVEQMVARTARIWTAP